jgi:hypothetical protein
MGWGALGQEVILGWLSTHVLGMLSESCQQLPAKAALLLAAAPVSRLLVVERAVQGSVTRLPAPEARTN